jgi:protein phosphatase
MLRATEITCKTDTGRQRRDNEDSAYARAPLFVVADGMGGAQAGEVASQLAIEAFAQELPDGTHVEQRLAERVREANRRIHERARADREHAGMGTTLTAAYLDQTCLVIAHVGDSRAYLMRDGRLQRLTRDHSLVGELVERGKLTEEEAAEHPQRSIITRALGPEADVEVDTWTYRVNAGDVLLLCSDGLTSMVSEDDVAAILARSEPLERAGDELIAAANAAGGRDNITVVLFRVEEAGVAAPDGPTMVTRVEPAAASRGGAPRTREEAGHATGAATATATAAQSGAEPSRQLVPAPPSPAAAEAAADPRVPGPAAAEAAAAPGAPGPAAASAPGPASALAARRGDAETRHRRRQRSAKPVAALLSVIVVLALVGAGGYLATRQLYFIGTDAQGVVTIYRGLPYDLPLGVHLYETVYVSGVPAVLIPADRRASLLDNRLRSQKDAISVVRSLELGKLSG